MDTREELVQFAKGAGWKGDSLESLTKWARSKNYGAFKILEDSEELRVEDFAAVWANTKAVTIVIPGDILASDLLVDDDASKSEDDELDDEEEVKAEDGEPDGDEEDEGQKRARAQVARQKRFLVSQDQFSNVKRVSVRTSKTGYNSREARLKSAYDRAVKNGEKFMGKETVFGSADEQEQFGAAARLCITKGGFHPYNKVNDDVAICGKAAGSTTDNAWAGTLIVSDVAPSIIDLLHKHGAARQLVSVTDMPDGVFDVKRKTSDMSFSYVAENGTLPETNPTLDQVELVAKKMAGISRLSNEVLNDTAFELGAIVAESTRAGANLFEDQDYFLGTHGTHGGLAGAIDSASTYDAALTSSWDDYTIPKLQAWRGMVPAEAFASGNVMIAASSAFIQSVLYRFALSAGGNVGQQMLSGVTNGQLSWDGIPVVLTEVLPSTYAANQTVAYIGAFDRGSKMGIVRGSEELSASGDRYWDQDQFAWRFKQRIAFNFHDIGGASSEVIALQD